MPNAPFHDYTLSEHRHRFAAWAAARAVARNFAATEVVVAAIDAASLQAFVADTLPRVASQPDSDAHHARLCERLLAYFELPSTRAKAPSYGYVAKTLAIYLKTRVGMRGVEAFPAAAYLHPPVDRELLKALRDYERKALGKKSSDCLFEPAHRLTPWTQFTAKEYGEVMRRIGVLLGEGAELWRVEALWGPTFADSPT